MEGRLKKIMAQVFDAPIESINNDASPDTIDNWDSVNHINLALALEQAFGISFEAEEIIEMMNFELILIILKEKGIC